MCIALLLATSRHTTPRQNATPRRATQCLTHVAEAYPIDTVHDLHVDAVERAACLLREVGSSRRFLPRHLVANMLMHPLGQVPEEQQKQSMFKSSNKPVRAWVRASSGACAVCVRATFGRGGGSSISPMDITVPICKLGAHRGEKFTVN